MFICGIISKNKIWDMKIYTEPGNTLTDEVYEMLRNDGIKLKYV